MRYLHAGPADVETRGTEAVDRSASPVLVPLRINSVHRPCDVERQVVDRQIAHECHQGAKRLEWDAFADGS